MSRKPGTDKNGQPFTDYQKRAVWTKAEMILSVNPKARRKDRFGAIVEWDNYGIRDDNGTGWEVDHIVPVSKGGDDNITNLQQLHWKNNKEKGDKIPDALTFFAKYF